MSDAPAGVAVERAAPGAQGCAQDDVVLVTGCSSGIGKACCEVLGAGRRRVYGASRTACAGHGWEYVRLDVTDDVSVQRLVADLAGREGRIDALVHCAGSSLAGSVEDTTVEEAQRQFDINFFGTVRVLRAVLPVMRRQGHGKIIVVGSIGGVIGLPYVAYYSASKFALDGLVEALRHEVAPFGIEVTIVHPGDFKTAIVDNQVNARNAMATSAYGEAFHKIAALYDRNVREGPSPQAVARKIDRLLSRSRLPVRTFAGSAIELLAVRLKPVVPSRAFEYLFRKAYGL